MFDQLFKLPRVLACYRTGPLLEERLAFLTHLASQGYSRHTLRQLARDHLAIAKMLAEVRLGRFHNALTLDDIKKATTNRHRLYPIAIRWLRFVGRLQPPPTLTSPCARKIRAFADHMEHDKGLSPATISCRCRFLSQFLGRLSDNGGSLSKVVPHRIDASLQETLTPQRYSKATIQTWTCTLRAFFRFAESRRWCRKGLAASIRCPRTFSQASLPLGPSWDDVQRLLTMTEGDQRHNIRARAILMLLAIYGLRAGEVNRLTLDDFDWDRELFRVVSSKTKRCRVYPLTRIVGHAILRYLQEVRPRSSHRELFLSLYAPFRPMRTSPWHLVAERFRSLQVVLQHYGPHTLRHACAARLLAAGLSLKEIGDQLGHTNPDTTRIYAKVDLVALRQVADFDLGGVQ